MRSIVPKPAKATGGRRAAGASAQVGVPVITTPARRSVRGGDGRLALSTVVALFGAPAVMADPRFAGIEHAIGREGLVSSGGDSDGGSGCSGGGDGGGGGCGGCGGS
jgi:hypothetical protein